MKKSTKKADIVKIIFVGTPLLLMLWGMMFIFLAYMSRDVIISKYGAFAFFVISIPCYIYLATKNASKLNAVLESDEEKIRNGDIKQIGFKKYVTKYDLWIAGIIIIILPLLMFIAQVIFYIPQNRISLYLKIGIPTLIIIEIIIKKIVKK